MLAARRIRFGRLQVYVEPRDIWVGAYVAPKALYVCPVPMLVIRWAWCRPYFCPSSGATECCSEHGGWDTCCARPDLHVRAPESKFEGDD